MAEGLPRRQPLCWVCPQERRNEGAGALRDGRPVGGREAQAGVEARRKLPRRVAEKGEVARQEDVEDDADRPQVYGGSVACGGERLGREVVGGAAGDGQRPSAAGPERTGLKAKEGPSQSKSRG